MRFVLLNSLFLRLNSFSNQNDPILQQTHDERIRRAQRPKTAQPDGQNIGDSGQNVPVHSSPAVSAHGSLSQRPLGRFILAVSVGAISGS